MKTSQLRIIVTPEPMGPNFQAKLVGRKEWAAGKTPIEAIGDLVLSHPEVFGAKVLITAAATDRLGEIQAANLGRHLTRR